MQSYILVLHLKRLQAPLYTLHMESLNIKTTTYYKPEVIPTQLSMTDFNH